jgi:hypothetical protein
LTILFGAAWKDFHGDVASWKQALPSTYRYVAAIRPRRAADVQMTQQIIAVVSPLALPRTLSLMSTLGSIRTGLTSIP